MHDPNRLARIKWQCRRGMLELDLILNHFINHQLQTLTEEELAGFETLLNCPDPELYSWLMGHTIPEHKEMQHAIKLVTMHNHPKFL